MKKVYKSILLFSLAIILSGIYSSCTKNNDAPNNGEPRIRYVRKTDPLIADSLLKGAFQGNLIAIVGENLGGAVEIWFNDQKALLTPTYITNTSILVSVPNLIPLVITDTLKIIFSNGKTLKYNFKVQINEPVISSMYSEYVAAHDTATIRGNYFYTPLSVTFPGGAKGELVSISTDYKTIKVLVPAGALSGQITVTTNFGATKSDFWFRDNRNIFVSSDPWAGNAGKDYVVTNPGPNDPPAINGNYIRVVNPSIGNWDWKEIVNYVTATNIPDEAILKPALYNLKFELNTTKPYNANGIRFLIGVQNDKALGDYNWNPPYNTKGKWQTVVIPYEEIVANYNPKLTIAPGGYYTRLVFCGNGVLDADMSFDNFRIVPKVIKK